MKTFKKLKIPKNFLRWENDSEVVVFWGRKPFVSQLRQCSPTFFFHFIDMQILVVESRDFFNLGFSLLRSKLIFCFQIFWILGFKSFNFSFQNSNLRGSRKYQILKLKRVRFSKFDGMD